jgi:SagB-type dehydrogenase family enzyme
MAARSGNQNRTSHGDCSSVPRKGERRMMKPKVIWVVCSLFLAVYGGLTAAPLPATASGLTATGIAVEGPGSAAAAVESTAVMNTKLLAAEPGGTIQLPPPVLEGDVSLEEALATRRSLRQFEDLPLTEAELGQLLWAGQGITDQAGHRTSPSAGALYPLELFVATGEGVFQYEPQEHRLIELSTEDARMGLYEASGGQQSVRQAPAVLVVTAVYERTTGQYGQERGTRYVRLEAGHATQNMLLQATALGLGGVSAGGFDDTEVQAVLALPADHQPLYLVPVGHPPAGSQMLPAAEPGGTTQLPPPIVEGDVSLEEALATRRSLRQFEDLPLTEAELGQLLWAGQGITGSGGHRTAPSAGALYPLELFVATGEGVFHYDPQAHELIVLSTEDARTGLYEASGEQESVGQAPAILVVTAVYGRTTGEFGQERGTRYVQLEAGHATQNMLLEATALGLGAVPVGSFDDAGVQAVLDLPVDHQPLYLVPAGHAPEVYHVYLPCIASGYRTGAGVLTGPASGWPGSDAGKIRRAYLYGRYRILIRGRR